MELVSRKNLFSIYLATSTALAAYAVHNALWVKPNVYAAGIELSKGLHLVTLTNWLIGWSILVGKLLQELMFGELRLIEIEHLYERAWFTLTNLLMTLAMFRSENNLLIFGMIMALIYLKIFHWILGDRLDYVFQQQQLEGTMGDTSAFKLVLCNRTTAMLGLFLVLDYQIIASCIDHAFLHSTDVFVVFGLDFLMVYLDLLEATLKYALNVSEMLYLQWHPDEEVWEPKVWLNKIGAIFISFFRLCAVGFVFIGLIYAYIIPVNFTRDVYVGVVKLVNQLKDFFYFLKAARDLDEHISDATEEDLQGQEMCIICRDDMTTDVPGRHHRTAPKKLPCGHVLHFGCLKSWLERSHCCPTCRREVFATGDIPDWVHHGEAGVNVPGAGAGAAEAAAEAANNANVEPQVQEAALGPDPVDAAAATDAAAAGAAEEAATEAATEAAADHTASVAAINAANEHSSGPFELTLPHGTVLPPDWTLLPLTRKGESGDDYEIRLNETAHLKLHVQPRVRKMPREEFDSYVVD